MKKSLLTVLLATITAGATAATVYDKDGTSLNVGGRIQSVFYNGNGASAVSDHGIADHDAGLINSARFSLEGSAKIIDGITAFAFTEWDMADGNEAANGEHLATREQYIGLDFDSFGKLYAGRMLDAAYAVQAATDVFEDYACVVNVTSSDFRSGQIRYDYDNNGIFASAAYQSAQDKVYVLGEDSYDEVNDNNIEGGFSTALGYTFDDVVFGPLSLKAGYSYLKGQDDTVAGLNIKAFDSFKNGAVSVTWGSLDSGLYLAGLYNVIRIKQKNVGVDNETETGYGKGYELVAGYAFENGVTVIGGYEICDLKFKTGTAKTNSSIVRRIPVLVNYQANPSFNVWAEAEFDGGTSDNAKDYKYNEDTFGTYDARVGTKFSVGARYTF
ncbi:MAG: porin [Succinivibrio sp.]